MIKSFLHFVIPIFGNYGYQILLLSAFLEGLPVIGSIVPGAFLAVFGGYMSRIHVLHFVPVVIISTVGAFVGDVLNYYLGKKYGYPFLKRFGKYFFLTEARLDRVRKKINEHSGKTLILGRFTSVTRSLSPFVAGASHVEIWKFLSFTALSAFLWAFTHVLIGFIFGRWLERFARYLGLIFFLAVNIEKSIASKV